MDPLDSSASTFLSNALHVNKPTLRRSFIFNKRLIKPLLVVRVETEARLHSVILTLEASVGPGTNPKYGSHCTESLIAT